MKFRLSGKSLTQLSTQLRFSIGHASRPPVSMAGLTLLVSMIPASLCFGQFTDVQRLEDREFNNRNSINHDSIHRDSREHSILEPQDAPLRAATASAVAPTLHGSHAVGPYADQSNDASQQNGPTVVANFGTPDFDNATAASNEGSSGALISNGAASISSPNQSGARPMNDEDDRDSDIRAQTGMKSAYQRSHSQQRSHSRSIESEALPSHSVASEPIVSEPIVSEPIVSEPIVSAQRDNFIVDRSVAPATYAAPVQDPRTTRRNLSQPARSTQRQSATAGTRKQSGSPSKVAESIIETFLPGANQATGDSASLPVSLRLADVLQQGQQRTARSQLVNQYWETFYDQAQSVSAQRHHDWVTAIRASKNTDQASVAVAQSNAENEVSYNRIQLTKSQAKLKSMIGSTSAILPSDLPTVKLVKTNYAAFKQRGLIPARFDGIDETLKELHGLVASRANTVQMAQQTAEQVKQYYQSNQTTVEHLLSAARAWRSAEADFVASTIEYNKAYADYALALPYGQAPVEQVVAMLVVPRASKTPTVADRRTSLSNAASPRSRSASSPITRSATSPITRSASGQRGYGQPSKSPRSNERPTQSPARSNGAQNPGAIRAASNGFGQQSRQSNPQRNQQPQRSAATPASYGQNAQPNNRRSVSEPAGFRSNSDAAASRLTERQPSASSSMGSPKKTASFGSASPQGFSSSSTFDRSVTEKESPASAPKFGASSFGSSANTPVVKPSQRGTTAPVSGFGTSKSTDTSTGGFSPPSTSSPMGAKPDSKPSPKPPSSGFQFGG